MRIQGHGTGKPIQTGVTVLELMITLSITALLLVTGAPALQQFSWNQEIKAATTALQQDLLAARGDAVLNGRIVIACPGTPDDGCLGSNDWSGGWIVFPDVNGDRQRQDNELLLRSGGATARVRITGAPSRTDLRFFPGGTTPGSNGTIALCGLAGPAQARKLVVSNIGRVRRDLYPEVDPSRCFS
jgi:type IV fimbrial biogenesis protein FimT